MSPALLLTDGKEAEKRGNIRPQPAANATLDSVTAQTLHCFKPKGHCNFFFFNCSVLNVVLNSCY